MESKIPKASTDQNPFTRRHNAILDRLVKAFKPPPSKITRVNQTVPGFNEAIRPNLLAVDEEKKTALIVDVAMPFENRYEAFERCRQGKRQNTKPWRSTTARRVSRSSWRPLSSNHLAAGTAQRIYAESTKIGPALSPADEKPGTKEAAEQLGDRGLDTPNPLNLVVPQNLQHEGAEIGGQLRKIIVFATPSVLNVLDN
uniref:Reverse transcriptase domain-containing protein n=1 Tax=Globodera pallida TaxID=36090 RepID=A0A183C9T6_GLOPA